MASVLIKKFESIWVIEFSIDIPVVWDFNVQKKEKTQ